MRLAALLLHRQGYQESIHLCQAVLVIDRYWEEAYRVMMIAHALRGNRPLAMRAYEQCRAALDEGLDLLPMAETTAIYTRIARGEPVLPP